MTPCPYHDPPGSAEEPKGEGIGEGAVSVSGSIGR